jgi:hypothetical protein
MPSKKPNKSKKKPAAKAQSAKAPAKKAVTRKAKPVVAVVEQPKLRRKRKRTATEQQLKIAEEYLKTGNARQAAANAGVEGSINKQKVVAHRALKNPEVQAYLRTRMRGIAASTDEVLAVLGDHLTANIGLFADYFKDDGGFDLKQAYADGKAHLIRSIKQTPVFGMEGEKGWRVELQLHDAQAAAGKLINVLGLKQQPGENQRDKERKAKVVNDQVRQLLAEGFNREQIEDVFTRVDAEMLQFLTPEMFEYQN